MLLLLSLACSDNRIVPPAGNTGRRGDPTIGIWPEQIVFDALDWAEIQEEEITITNHGEETLAVSDITVSGTEAFWVEYAPFGLEPGDALDLPVFFTPLGVDNVAEIHVASNDPYSPRTSIPLEGFGREPALEIDPVDIDLGDVTLDCSTEQTFTLSSVGEAPLTISEIELVGDSYEIVWLPELPLVLDPDETTEVLVGLTPSVEGVYGATLSVVHDAVAAQTQATMQGLGVAPVTGEDVFYQGPFDTVDVFVYVDRSCSMSDDAANLAANFSTFTDALEELDSDWQVAIATRDDGCWNQELFTPDTESLDTKISDATRGESGRWTEAGLTVSLNGLGNADSGDCNDGLLRPGARTSLILLSD